LIRSHEASFAEIKKYYNNITKDNLKLIRLLKVWCCRALALLVILRLFLRAGANR
jgi:hypothetical protein